MAKKSTTTGNNKSTSTRRVSAGSSKKSSMRGKSTPRKPASKTTSKRAAKQSTGLTGAQKSLIIGVVLLFTTAVIILSLISPDQGAFTAFVSRTLGQGFGLGRFVIPLVTGLAGFYFVLRGMEQEPKLPVRQLAGAGLLFVVLLAFASLVAMRRSAALPDLSAVAAAGQGGGYGGSLTASVLTEALGDLGAIITLMLIGVVGAILVSGVTRADANRWIAQLREARAAAAVEQPGERTIRINPGRQPQSATQPQPSGPTQLRLVEDKPQEAPPAAQSGRGRASRAGRTTPAPSSGPTSAPSQPAPSPVYVGGDAAATTTVQSVSPNGPVWTLPVVADVLDTGSDLDVNSASIRERVEIIEHTLESFGAPATVVEINQGPTITQFGVEPNYIQMRNGKRTKVKVGKIASLGDDLALALAARSIRIQAPVPGKGYVGIEVPNSAKALVSLRDVMESDEFGRTRSPLAIGLGQNVAGQPIVADLTAMPHLLIAGTTGSGKSVCVNALIACLMLQNTPDDLRLVMIDPKRVELTGYNGIPHLAAPVVVEMDRVIGTLQWSLREMDNRYKLFADAGARNITEYNKKVARRANTPKLPYIVVIVDELADLMMLAPEDTERAITRLAQMARATGIHMVIATQRPSVDVVTGLIKANFPARIAFAVASSTDSRVILDATGAERLLGQGDMLFQSPDAAAPVRLQGCFVSESELHRLIGYWQTARRSQVIPASDAIRRDEQPAPAAVPPPIVNQAATGATAAATTTAAASRSSEPDERVPARTTATTPAAQSRTESKPSPARAAAVETAASAQTETATSSTPPATEPPDEQPELPPPHPGITQQPLWEALEEMGNGDGDDEVEIDDDLYPEAVALVRSLNRASTSLLQRRFRIGYTRAARLIDAMEAQGIIGPPTGTSKAREVLGGVANEDTAGGEAAAE